LLRRRLRERLRLRLRERHRLRRRCPIDRAGADGSVPATSVRGDVLKLMLRKLLILLLRGLRRVSLLLSIVFPAARGRRSALLLLLPLVLLLLVAVAVVVVAAAAVACRMSLVARGIPVTEARSHMDVEPARTPASAAGLAVAVVVPVVAGRTAAAAAAAAAAAEVEQWGQSAMPQARRTNCRCLVDVVRVVGG
jgi:hypothetical protein